MSQAPPLSDLKAVFADFLVDENALRPPLGLPTGLQALDERLLWKGLPKGELSLLLGQPGGGLTSLWLKAAESLTQSGRWAAWMNSDWALYPSQQKIRWDRLMVMEQPSSPDLFFWILQEMITSSLFDLIGCHLTDFSLKRHQLVKIKALARAYQVAMVFISSKPVPQHPLYALILEGQQENLIIRRALHRQKDQLITGALHDARFLPALFQRSRLQLG
ncbi:MAG: recA protein [Bdellovibrionaceae bacterium]|nr:recA protein [Pseudobdellovibrionaceae bacterium]